MKKRFSIFLLLCIAAAVMLLAACGEDKKASADDKKSPDAATAVTETTAVIETTAEGGTVEQDPEGYKITKDTSGKVVAVEDKDGNPVDVKTYLSTHAWVEDPGSASDSSKGDSGNSGDKDSSSKTDSDSNNGSSNAGSSAAGSGKSDDKTQATVADEDAVEGSIPVIIATMPDDEDLIELPDL